jgi:hypothetical protein
VTPARDTHLNIAWHRTHNAIPAQTDMKERSSMSIRTRTETITFRHPFSLKGVEQVLPGGDYRVLTDEALIEGLSFPAYRRISTMIFVPSQFYQSSAVELLTVDPLDLSDAQARDRATPEVLDVDAMPAP